MTDPWTARMRRGDFPAAWEISDARITARRAAGFPPRWDRPRHLQPVWNGDALEGRRVLVRCYHGLGDTAQFVRYAPMLAAVASEVIVWAQPALVPLVRTVSGVGRVLPLHDGSPDAEFDADVEIMELPHVFRSTLDTLPAAVPYLRVEPRAGTAASGAILTTRARDRRAVGIIWRAGGWDERRSVPLSMLVETLAGVPWIDWYRLQRGVEEGDFTGGGTGAFGVDVSSDDPMETARIMRMLDLIITVDSFPAHLAGALGAPVWTLLHAEPDWRWLDAPREDSPWYPTMCLFRQDPARPGDWRPVLERMARELT